VKVTREKTESSQVFLTIEMEPAEVEESLEQSYRRLVKKVKIPGFRKGKASRDVLERYIGKDSLLEEALEHLVPDAYERAVREQEIEAIAQPQIEVAQTDPLVFRATIPVKPTVELGDYRSIQVKAEPVQVTDDEVNSVIEQLRHHYATWEPVEHPVEVGDLAVIDVESSIGGSPFINREGAQYQVLSGMPFPAPGFPEQLVGMVRGEEKEFSLHFPPDFPRGELANKRASFTVKVNEVKKENLPELDDGFAHQVNPEWENLDTLREQVAADMRARAEDEARRNFEERVVEAVVDLAQVEFPPVLVEEGIKRLLDERLKQWQSGAQGLEEYLRQAKKTEAELREELRPLAVKRVTTSLALEKIAETENIEASDAEIDDEVQMLTGGVDESKKDDMERVLSLPESRQSIRGFLIVRNTVKRLVAIAEANSEGGAGDVQDEVPS